MRQYEIVANPTNETKEASLCRLAKIMIMALTDASDLDGIMSVITTGAFSPDEMFCTSVLRAFNYLMDNYGYEMRCVYINEPEITICFTQRIHRMRRRKVTIKVQANYKRVSILFTERSLIHLFSDKTLFVVDSDDKDTSIETLSRQFYCEYLKYAS